MTRRSLLALSVIGALATLSAPSQAADHHQLKQSGAFDLAVANEDKLIEMLKASGKIAKDANMQQAETALRAYLKERQQQAIQQAGKMDYDTVEALKLHSKSKARGKAATQTLNYKGAQRPAPLELEPYEGELKTARVLAILMEFPDFPHNSIEPGETDMYYEDYAASHYAELLFSANGWSAPNGFHVRSMANQYFEQSGGSYTVEGGVAGWYMAEKPAAYYGNNDNGDIRSLVREALTAAAADPGVDLTHYDIEDRYDLDGDGNVWEPDGLVDHIMIFHASVGEEAGGGQLGEDAIWAHRWNLGAPFAIPGTDPIVDPLGLGAMGAFDYTVQPADSAVGIVSHEYGHDLGLPDEYDTQYTGRGEPVSSWSIMSSGSWAGLLAGTEPTGFSAYAKEFLQNRWGGNWLSGGSIHLDDIPSNGVTALLDQAVDKGTNNDAIRIDLPPQQHVIVTPPSGSYAYFSGSGNDLSNGMAMPLDLTSATSASVAFKTWYDIENDWDYGYLMVRDSEGNMTPMQGNITVTTNPHGNNQGHGITGQSNGWVDAEFDLSAFAGQAIEVVPYYWTDGAAVNPGIYMDDFVITVDGSVVATDNAESDGGFTLEGFTRDTGMKETEHYYLLEWRTHQGIDKGLRHVNVAGRPLRFEEGLLIWYVDTNFGDNWVGIHPGDGFVGVVDANREDLYWSNGNIGSTRYQIHDATFNNKRSRPMKLDLRKSHGLLMRDYNTRGTKVFDDSNSFMSEAIPDAGRNVPNYGLKVEVLSQSRDKSVAQIRISR